MQTNKNTWRGNTQINGVVYRLGVSPTGAASKSGNVECTKELSSSHPTHKGRGGFALIEVLVVVLIIGILAAVALPQYQFAVDKSRFAPYLTLANSIGNAEQLYFLANGTYTNQLSQLDIDLTKVCPSSAWDTSRLWDCAGGFHIDITDGGNGFRITYCADSECPVSAWQDRTHICSLVYRSNNYQHPACVSSTARGNRLCNYFMQQFSVN